MKSIIIILHILPGFPRPVSWEGPGIVVEVQKTSEEYKRVATEFEGSVGCRVSIVKIVRIQNDQLWQAYQANKQVVSRQIVEPERMLYHGCPSRNVDSINTNGFTARLAGTSNGEHTTNTRTAHAQCSMYKQLVHPAMGHSAPCTSSLCTLLWGTVLHVQAACAPHYGAQCSMYKQPVHPTMGMQ